MKSGRSIRWMERLFLVGVALGDAIADRLAAVRPRLQRALVGHWAWKARLTQARPAMQISGRAEKRNGDGGILVRVREHLFLPGGDARRATSRRRAASTLAWRPFLLGPIFAAQGWRDSPFNIYPAKGRYMWRDMERICDTLELPLKRPKPFPQNSLLAARVALALDGERRANFSRAVYLRRVRRGPADRRTRDACAAAEGARPRTRSGASPTPRARATRRCSKPRMRARPTSGSLGRPAS